MSTPQGPQQPAQWQPPFPQRPILQQPPAPQPKKKPFGWLAMIIATASALIIGSCAGSVAGGAAAGAPQAAVTVPGPTVTVTQKAEQPAEKKEEPAKEPEEPKEEPQKLGDGIYEVGVDIKPGRYKTVVPDDSLNCYWERLKNDSGEFDAIIANENSKPGARVSVTIKKSDGFFKSTGCGDWKRS